MCRLPYVNGQAESFESEKAFQKLLRDLYRSEWVVYAKRPFGGPEQVIQYLGRYTHRVAISNRRIQSIEDGKVSFSYKDYRQDGQKKIMTLDAVEFIRRFVQHILPPGFHKIRYYGILATRNRKTKLAGLQRSLDYCPPQCNITAAEQPAAADLGHAPPKVCPVCGALALRYYRPLAARMSPGQGLSRAPPKAITLGFNPKTKPSFS